jgi:hypothetical protein
LVPPQLVLFLRKQESLTVAGTLFGEEDLVFLAFVFLSVWEYKRLFGGIFK